MTQWTPDEREAQFLERLARLMEEDGGPRIAGRLVGLMLLSPGEMGLDDMAERLQVSKASVSTNARMLENLGVLERVGRPGDRRDFYRVAPDAMTRLMERRVAWLRRFGEVVEDAATTRAAQEPVVRSRFRELCRVQRRAVRNAERVLRLFRRGAG